MTLCAHREFKAVTKGKPFGAVVGATYVSPEQVPYEREPLEQGVPKQNTPEQVTYERKPLEQGVPKQNTPEQRIIAAEWKRCGEVRDDVFPGEFVVMPDHFHGLIRIQKNKSELGHVIGAFKAAVSRKIRRGDTHVAFPEKMRIWHRNYYEIIVRTKEAEEKIRQYIRMNPWRCVQQFDKGLRGMGNPALWNMEKLGVCCSRNAPKPKSIPRAEVYFSGFHSPMEKEIFAKLLELKKPMIWCPAWGVGTKRFSPELLEALEGNRMLILEMKNKNGDLAAARERNAFVMQAADRIWLPYVTKGGMIDRLWREFGIKNIGIMNGEFYDENTKRK